MNIRHMAGVLVVGVSLGGCSAANLLGGSAAPAQPTRIPVGNELALPPDLSLKAPTRTTDAYVPNAPAADAGDDVAVATAPATPARPAVAPKRSGGTLDEQLAYYNISKFNADGTPKSSADISRELAAAIKAEKRRANPNYGTIFNMGNIFSDG